MGGYTPARCATTTWRGRTVCKHSVPKLEAWAKSTGHIYIDPIQGCYSTAVAASSGTHAGGGVYDIEMDFYTVEEGDYAVNKGRKVLLVTFGRWWKGNRHIHLIDPACPTLAPEAVGQMGQFRNGETGMVGPGDIDTWDRSTKDEIMRVFDNRFKVSAPTGQRTYTIPKGGTLGAAAIALGTTVALLASFNGIENPNVVTPGQVVTAPPSGYVAPAPKPSAPAPAPTVKAPTTTAPKPAPTTTISVSASDLKAGKRSASVKAYEQALSRKGYLAARWVDGYYGTETSAATKRAYRHIGVTPNATEPGPQMLRHLGLTGKVAPAKAVSNTVSRAQLYVGKHGTSVLAYEKALRAFIGTKQANAFGLTSARAADRYFGTATAEATKAAYRKLGVTPNATSPGPYLLSVLGLKAAR